MCDPLTAAGVALSVGSVAANQMAQSRVNRARTGAVEAENTRQRQLQNEAGALTDQSRDRYVDFEGQQEERGGDLGEFFSGQGSATGNAPQLMPQSGSDITVREEGSQRGQARDFSNQQGAALGNLRAFGDLMGSTGRLQQRDTGQVGMLNSFMQGSSNVLPLELQAANQRGGGLRTLGDIMGGLGGAATTAGLSGATLPGMGGGPVGAPTSILNSAPTPLAAGATIRTPRLTYGLPGLY